MPIKGGRSLDPIPALIMWKALRHHGQATSLSQSYFNQYFKHVYFIISFLFYLSIQTYISVKLWN